VRVAVVIPARLESTRLPRKLLLAESGVPLIAHTVRRVLEAAAASGGLVARVVVAADDDALVLAARQAGAEAVLTDRGHRSGTDRIAEAARALDEDVVVNVQGDEAEIPVEHVLAAARVLRGASEPMGTLAYPVADEAAFRNPNLVKAVTDSGGRALLFTRAPVPFPRDGRAPPDGVWCLGHVGVYAFRRGFLLRYPSLPPSGLEERESLEQLRALEAGYRIRVALVSPPEGRPVDTREDYDAFLDRLVRAGVQGGAR
jgi:3-deoxy-manno-octulosonate cytidylyltransferase (CMP-KDO synthetase)